MHIYTCRTKKELIKVLKEYTTTQLERIHIEWVWDGITVKLVQGDIEKNVGNGTKPGDSWVRTKLVTPKTQLNYFTEINKSIKDWRKVACVKTFINCDLPYGDIYILESPDIIKELSQEKINNLLLADLGWLLLCPVTIRMDIQNVDEYNNIMLPRTETLFTADQAIKFLIKYSKSFVSNGLLPDNFCFLIHRFIISDSCALAFSKPHLRKARIDSTWGIVEGLYFHPHDSFEVNLMNTPPSIKKQIRCKTEYIDVDKNGNWFSKKTGTDYDWAESLTKDQISKIASYNIKIAEHLDSLVTVMYFVGVDQTTGYPEILPWFYTTDEITDKNIKFTEVIFSEFRYVIESKEDFKKIEEEFDSGKFSKITLKLKLNPDLSRDKRLIENIGHFANQKQLAIELEGSVLSHTYYILHKLNVRVKCLETFDPKYKKQEFYKLVRDKIPINIESKGEKARYVRIPSNDLLQFIKEKAVEEALEFFFEKQEDKIIEELADIYEVIRTACKIFGTPMEEVIKIADSKTEKKGGFEAGVVLVNTEESSLIDVTNPSGESLLDTKSKENTKGKIKKRKRISFGTDNSITLPYILQTDQLKNKDLTASVSLNNIESIKITYQTNGIKISFISQKEQIDQNQLRLF